MTGSVKTFTLADGQTAMVRQPTVDDAEALTHFLGDLPPMEQACLRYDATDLRATQRRLLHLDGENHFRIIVEVETLIIGDLTLDREPYGWTHHVANMRGVVAPGKYEVEASAILFREGCRLAEDVAIERLMALVLPQHTRLVATLEQTGFVFESQLKGFAKDGLNQLSDLLVYSNDLEKVWKQAEAIMLQMDIRMEG